MKIPTLATVLGLATMVSAEVFLHETFSDGEGWTERWTPSTHREDLGKFEVSPGKWFANEAAADGLKTSQDYRFYATSTKIKPFNNKGKDLVIQYDVKNEQDIDCGGSYLKIFDEKLDPVTFNGDSEYNIMFGPDICGPKAKVHAIFNYKGTNYELKKSIIAPKDTLTHTYTLIVKPDQSYDILIDGESKVNGTLLEDWDFLPPKTIKDPEASKPADWVEEALIDDEKDVKPANSDDIPEFIPNPEATKPEDWDDDMDGDWEVPVIANPEYKGPWSPKKIANPLYKGEWEHPHIDNPEYKVDDEIYAYDFGNVGIDIWQVKSGTIFDNILITDDIAEAEKIRNENIEIRKNEAKIEEALKKKLEVVSQRSARVAEKGENAFGGALLDDLSEQLDETAADKLIEDLTVRKPKAADKEKEADKEVKKESEEKSEKEVEEEKKEHIKDEL